MADYGDEVQAAQFVGFSLIEWGIFGRQESRRGAASAAVMCRPHLSQQTKRKWPRTYIKLTLRFFWPRAHLSVSIPSLVARSSPNGKPSPNGKRLGRSRPKNALDYVSVVMWPAKSAAY
jgi:hypothetical protein